MTTVNQVVEELKKLSSEETLDKLSHFGIENSTALGVKVPDIRKLAKRIGINHTLALELWNIDIHEAHLLASMIAEPKLITENDLDKIVSHFNSWDTCDISCDLIYQTPYALDKIYQYADSEYEFVKRTAFALICNYAFYSKKNSDEFYYPFLELIEREAWDDRNFVKKAVNWALRQIGKRNEALRLKAIETAERILKQDTKSARWIAKNALKELNDEKIVTRVRSKNN